MYAWMTLMGRVGEHKELPAPKKVPTFSEVHTARHTCVAPVNGGLCGKDAASTKQHGWLCHEHDREAFPFKTPKQ